MKSYLDNFEVTKQARSELIQKAYFAFDTKTFNDGEVNIEIYRKLDQAIIQVGKEYRIENARDKTLLDMIEIAIEMKKQNKELN